MAKKIMCFVIVLLLMFASSINLYASNLDALDNRDDVENTAGITSDEINEMAQNSPNSLTPIQGLVLWMFAIIAFLKLAQKMDDLLQKLGLNVTQTGGRALGDLMVAGAALRNAGKLMSKGMGALGLGGGSGSGSGGGSGGTGSSGGTSTSGAGRGPTPIPTGGTSGKTPSASGNPSGISFGGGTSPSHSTTSTPTAGASAAGRTQVSGTNASNPASTSTPTHANSATKNRNPVGRAVEWMRGDGIAQGAIRAGAKGGLIGLSAYGAKIGATKIGSAVSAGMNNNRISSNPQNESYRGNSSTVPTTNQPSQSNSAANPEGFQASRPLEGADNSDSIPASINSEDYQDVVASVGSGAGNSDFTPTNSEEYNEVGAYDNVTAAQSIAASADDIQNIDANESAGTGEMMSFSSVVNDETWQEAATQDITGGDTPISITNNEDWNDSGNSAQLSSYGGASNFIADSGATSATTHDASVVQNSDISNGEAASQDASDVVSSAKNTNDIRGHEVATPTTAITARNQAILNELSQGSTTTSTTKDMPTNDTTRTNIVSHDLATQTPIQSGSTAVGAKVDSTTPMTQTNSVQPAQMQAATEVIRTDAPAASQTQAVGVKYEGSSSEPAISQQKTTVQSHTTQISNATKTDSPNQLQTPPQSTSQPTNQSTTQSSTPSRPTAKGKSKNSTVKGRKRNR